MKKAVLYKCSLNIEDIKEKLGVEGFTNIYGKEADNGKIEIYQKQIDYTEGSIIDEKIKFLRHSLLYAENIYIILFEIESHLYWIRRGGAKCFIDKYKNINYPLYYFSNITDYEKYSFVEKKEKTFNLFSGEQDTTTIYDMETSVQKYLDDASLYNTLIDRFKVRVPVDSMIGEDLNLAQEVILSFTNGIEILFDTETEESFCNTLNIVNNIRDRNGNNTIKRFYKLQKKVQDLNFTEIEDLSGLFKVENKEALYSLNSLTVDDLDPDGYYYKNLIGFYEKNEKKYYINYKSFVYNIKVDEVDIRNLISSDNEVLNAIAVYNYRNENHYIDQIENINSQDKLIHKFHKSHYKKNAKSKFEICDIFYWDKINKKKYLIFVKYEYTMKSSEVFWQSSFVYKKFENNEIVTEKLEELFEKVNFPEEERKLEHFMNAYYVNLILPKGDNVSSENLSHVINLWKNDSMANRMNIIVPKTLRIMT